MVVADIQGQNAHHTPSHHHSDLTVTTFNANMVNNVGSVIQWATYFEGDRKPFGSLSVAVSFSHCDSAPWKGMSWLYSVQLFNPRWQNGNIFRATGHLCGEFTGDRWIPAQRPVTWSFDVIFDLSVNRRLNKQSWGCDLRCNCAHYDVIVMIQS